MLTHTPLIPFWLCHITGPYYIAYEYHESQKDAYVFALEATV